MHCVRLTKGEAQLSNKNKYNEIGKKSKEILFSLKLMNIMNVGLHKGKGVKHELFTKSISWKNIFFINLEQKFAMTTHYKFWTIYKYQDNYESVMKNS